MTNQEKEQKQAITLRFPPGVYWWMAEKTLKNKMSGTGAKSINAYVMELVSKAYQKENKEVT